MTRRGRGQGLVEGKAGDGSLDHLAEQSIPKRVQGGEKHEVSVGERLEGAGVQMLDDGGEVLWIGDHDRLGSTVERSDKRAAARATVLEEVIAVQSLHEHRFGGRQS